MAVSITTAVGWGMSVAGWVISPVLSDTVMKGYALLKIDASEKLKKLTDRVHQIGVMLGHEGDEITPHMCRLEQLLDDLRSAFYEADEFLDNIEYQRLKSNFNLSHQRNWVKKFQNTVLPWPCPKIQGSHTNDNDALPLRLKKKLMNMLDKIEGILNEAHNVLTVLNLQSARNETRIISANLFNPSGCPSELTGQDKFRQKVVRMLRKKEAYGRTVNHDSCYSVIGIHGIAGCGKTTLAHSVYSHERKSKHFDLVVWINVSSNCATDIIFKAVLDAATGKSSLQCSTDTMKEALKEQLSGKRYLLVLDDIWFSWRGATKNELTLDLFPLKHGAAGSKILVTSRSADVPIALGAVKESCLAMPDLDDNAFFQLFMGSALRGSNMDNIDRRNFELIGADIAKKLKRSPLAAKTVGGQLCTRLTVEFWLRVQKQNLLNDTMGALWWSYKHLPEPLRRCFAYCGIFPRKHHLYRSQVVNLWVAEGLVRCSDSEEDPESVASIYFDELVSSSFFQPGVHDVWDKDFYVVHDLLYDVAVKFCGKDFFRVEYGWTGQIPKNVRYLFVQTDDSEILKKISSLQDLRTLIIDNDKWVAGYDSMLLGLRKLRVLIIPTIGLPVFSCRFLFLRKSSGHDMVTLPCSIYNLRYLRYLALWGACKASDKLIISSKLAHLYHIQVLDFGLLEGLIFHCDEGISNLSKLHHLISSVSVDVPNIGRITSLRTLRFFTVKKEEGFEIKQLQLLNNLRDTLHICGLENVSCKEDATEANLSGKKDLQGLILEWSYEEETCNREIESEVLDALSPPAFLQKLEIRSYRGLTYPCWLVRKTATLSNLRELSFRGCRQLSPAPAPEFQFLVALESVCLAYCSWNTLPESISCLVKLNRLEIECCPNIQALPTLPQSLQHFKLKDCSWGFLPKSVKDLRRLKRLEVSCCRSPEVQSLPNLRKSTRRFKLEGCDEGLMKSCQTIGDPNWLKLVHVPNQYFIRATPTGLYRLYDFLIPSHSAHARTLSFPSYSIRQADYYSVGRETTQNRRDRAIAMPISLNYYP